MDTHYRARLLRHLADLSKSPTGTGTGTSERDRAILTGLRETIDQLLELSPPCSPTPAVAVPVRMEGEEVGDEERGSTMGFSGRLMGMERIEEEEVVVVEVENAGCAAEEDADEEVVMEEYEAVEEGPEDVIDNERRFQRLSRILANLQAQAERAVYGPDEMEEEEEEEEEENADEADGEIYLEDGETSDEYTEDEEHEETRVWDTSSIHTVDLGPDWRNASRPQTRCEMRLNDLEYNSDLEPHVYADDTSRTTSVGTQDLNQLDCMRLLTPPPSNGMRRRRRRTIQRCKTLEPSPIIHDDGGRNVDEESKHLVEDVVGGEDEVERLLVELLQTRETEVTMFRLVWMWMGTLGVAWTLVGLVLGWGCRWRCPA